MGCGSRALGGYARVWVGSVGVWVADPSRYGVCLAYAIADTDQTDTRIAIKPYQYGCSLKPKILYTEHTEVEKEYIIRIQYYRILVIANCACAYNAM